MKTLHNILYITVPETYLSLDGENLVVLKDGSPVKRVPLHNLEGIVAFGYMGASPALMGACAKRQIDLCFMSGSGRFLARIVGPEAGNILLRKEQYRRSDSETASAILARNMIIGKLLNTRQVLERAKRDHAPRLDVDKLGQVSAFLQESARSVQACTNLASIRGIEGKAATAYFSVFNQLILQQEEDFVFKSRNRRPPLDLVNALLSFAYTLLANEVTAALQAVGLDPYVGFLHRDRPGRPSLALDLMEELRPIMADRFVLSLINRAELSARDFTVQKNGAVLLDDTGRRTLLQAWQSRKLTTVTHPFTGEKLAWGLLPHIQAMLLARHLRGDLDGYPPYLWR